MSNKRIIYCQRVVEAISFLILVLLFIALYVCENTGVSVKRGFFCDDRSIRFPYKDGTVPTFTLVIISVLLPAIIVSIKFCWLEILRLPQHVIELRS